MENNFRLVYSNIENIIAVNNLSDVISENDYLLLFDEKNNSSIHTLDNCNYARISANDLQSIAPAVIDCAEKFGCINSLLFAPYFMDEDEVFLDITEDNFNSYLSYLSAFFALCKCTIPYMLGFDSPKIVVVMEENPVGASRCMYKSSLLSMVNEMQKEFSMYNVTIETRFYSNSMNLVDFL